MLFSRTAIGRTTTTTTTARFSQCRRRLSRFAAVDHGSVYEAALHGLHGHQLALAQIEGYGKDDPPFDPFIEDELLEARLKEQSKTTGGVVEDDEASSSSSSSSSSDDEDRYRDSDRDEVNDDGYEGDDSEKDEESESLYNNDGSLRWKKSQLATFRAGAPAGGLFAIIELAGSQHKVTTDDVLIVNRLKPLKSFQIGSVHSLDNVMLVGSSHFTLVGMPFVAGAQVDVMVEEITQDEKVVIFKKRRRKNSKRKNGFRRDVTMLRIIDIRPPKEFQNVDYRPRLTPYQADSDLA